MYRWAFVREGEEESNVETLGQVNGGTLGQTTGGTPGQTTGQGVDFVPHIPRWAGGLVVVTLTCQDPPSDGDQAGPPCASQASGGRGTSPYCQEYTGPPATSPAPVATYHPEPVRAGSLVRHPVQGPDQTTDQEYPELGGAQGEVLLLSYYSPTSP